MEKREATGYVSGLVSVIIGIYMLITYIGKALPPTLSGIAFIFIGISLIIDKYLS